MKIIFLDFDGVLDNAYYDEELEKRGLPGADKHGTIFDPECVENLRHIIEVTNAKVVVSSDWKYIMSFMELLDMWEERDLPGELIGNTPNCSLHRGGEIDEWLAGCDEPVDYVILDDMDASCFNEHQLSRLLIVNAYTGLDEETAERAITLLNR